MNQKDYKEIEHPMDKFNPEKVTLFQHPTNTEKKMILQMKEERPSTEWHDARIYYGCDVSMIIRRVMEIMKSKRLK